MKSVVIAFLGIVFLLLTAVPASGLQDADHPAPILYKSKYAMHSSRSNLGNVSSILSRTEIESFFQDLSSKSMDVDSARAFFEARLKGHSIQLVGRVAPANSGLKLKVDLDDRRASKLHAVLVPIKNQLARTLYMSTGQRISFDGVLSGFDFSPEKGLSIRLDDVSFRG